MVVPPVRAPMMTLRQTFLRVPTTNWINSLSKYGHQQKRLASVSSQIFQSQPERPPRTDFLEKYQEKLERKAKEEGVSSISDLMEQYKPTISSLNKKLAGPPPKFNNRKSGPSTPLSIPPAVSPVKTLSSYVDVDKLRRHTDSKEIELIWRAGHTKDALICAVIPSPIYHRMATLARDHPMFILPLPRDSGIEMHFMQFKFPEANVTHILFTSLLEYKTHGEFARPHTTVMHFEDLAEEKGIVLMRGEVDGEQRGIGLDDARTLVMGVQKLYGADLESERGRNRRKLVEEFTRGSEEFDISKLLDELNRID